MQLLTTADVIAIIDRSPISGWQARTILLCLLVSACIGYDTQCIAFVAPSLGHLWRVGRADFGLVFSAALIGTLIGSLALAPLGDKYGRKPIIVGSVLIFAVFSLASTFAADMHSLALYRGFTGVGLGAGLPPVIALAYEYAPARKRTLITTCVSLGFTIGGMAGAAFSTMALPLYGWRSVFALGGVGPLIAVGVVWAFLPESIRVISARTDRECDLSASLGRIDSTGDYSAVRFAPRAGAGHHRAPIRALFAPGRAMATWMLWLVFLANLFMINFMINWLPSVLHAAGLPVSEAITAITVFDLGGLIAGIGCAWAVDRLRSYEVLPVAYVLTAVAIGCIGLLEHHIVGLFTAIFFSGAGVIGAFSGMNVLAGAIYPTSARTTGVAWAFGVGHVGSVLGPLPVALSSRSAGRTGKSSCSGPRRRSWRRWASPGSSRAARWMKRGAVRRPSLRNWRAAIGGRSRDTNTGVHRDRVISLMARRGAMRGR